MILLYFNLPQYVPFQKLVLALEQVQTLAKQTIFVLIAQLFVAVQNPKKADLCSYLKQDLNYHRLKYKLIMKLMLIYDSMARHYSKTYRSYTDMYLICNIAHNSIEYQKCTIYHILGDLLKFFYLF
jgi:hypothetical protein